MSNAPTPASFPIEAFMRIFVTRNDRAVFQRVPRSEVLLLVGYAATPDDLIVVYFVLGIPGAALAGLLDQGVQLRDADPAMVAIIEQWFEFQAQKG